jgi:hypothetical protein
MTTNNKNIFVFCDKISDNYIVFRKDGKDVWIDKYYVDPDNGKLFVILLKDSFEKMKRKGCETYKQIVDADEWESFLKNIFGWEIISQDNENKTILLSCTIDDAPICITNSLLK